jgi:hypothetical protein
MQSALVARQSGSKNRLDLMIILQNWAIVDGRLRDVR